MKNIFLTITHSNSSFNLENSNPISIPKGTLIMQLGYFINGSAKFVIINKDITFMETDEFIDENTIHLATIRKEITNEK